jgi:hypothetical protein
MLSLDDALGNFESTRERLSFRVCELVAVRRVVTEAIDGTTGARVHVHCSPGSDNNPAVALG